MKIYIKANSNSGYLYIFKHGIGPGTLPKDVTVIRSKDLPNYYTAVWLDRFLTADELKQYDIPSETRINELLDRIGYCQKGKDVVPCDEVTASTEISEDADLPTFKEFATTEWDVLNDGSKRLKLKDLFVYYGTDKQWNASDPGYWYEIRIGDKTYKESKKYSIKNRENCYKAMQNAVKKLLDSNAEALDDVEACDKVMASEYTSYWKDFNKIVGVIVEFLDSHDKVSQKELYDYLAEAGFSNIDSELVGKAWDSALSLYESRVNACGDIKASSYTAPNKKLVFKDGDSYEFHYTSGEGDVFEPKPGSGNWWTSYIVTPDNRLLSWEFSGRYTPVDAVYGKDFWVEDNSVESCSTIQASTDPATSDFTVIQNIYSDGVEYMTKDNVMPVYTQEYGANLADITAEHPTIFDGAMKGWTDETFKPGDILTEGRYAAFGFIKRAVGSDMYADYKDYVSQHPEFPDPCRDIEIRINNPKCLPSAEEQRRREGEAMGRWLGQKLGIGRINSSEDIKAANRSERLSNYIDFMRCQLVYNASLPRDFAYGLGLTQLRPLYNAWDSGDIEEYHRLLDEYGYDSYNVEGCDSIKASSEYSGRYSPGRLEDDGTEDFYMDTQFNSWDEACCWGLEHDCTHIYDRQSGEFLPIESSTDTKYFANMVNCSSDPELDDNFLVEGYYDEQRRGLAESYETSDISALNETINEYANQGHYIVVHNLTDGVITEFSADNWFNDIAPDGGAELFMSW